MNDIIVKTNDQLNEKYYKISHKSGLDVYIIPKEMSTTYATFATRYGSMDNKFKLEGDKDFVSVPDGIAHFLEHKMFECEDGKDVFELFAKTGANANAYTANTMTSYLFSATDNFYTSLEYLLDFVTHPYFTKENVEKELGIIGQEIRMYNDNPYSRMQRGLFESMYKYNKIRIDIAGTEESIHKIDENLLYTCYNIFYNLHNMALVICGNVDVNKTISVLDKVLKESEQQKIIRAYDDENEPDSVVRDKVEIELEVAKPIFAIGIKDNDISPDPYERMKKAYAVGILNNMLFSQSSELYNSLYEKKLIGFNLSFDFEHTKHYSHNVISAESSSPYKAYEFFVNFIDLLKEKGLSYEDFELCKKAELADSIKVFDSTEAIAEEFVFNLFDDADMLDTADCIKSITFDYVNDVFDNLFSKEKYTISVVMPKNK